jgi:hypothetical protein
VAWERGIRGGGGVGGYVRSTREQTAANEGNVRVFLPGVFVGLAIAALIAGSLIHRQRVRISSLELQLSNESGRVSALENEVAVAKAEGALAVRNEKLRNAREFGQYKKLLRRADVALAQAKAKRDDSVLEAA